jgi:hypothetical protein
MSVRLDLVTNSVALVASADAATEQRCRFPGGAAMIAAEASAWNAGSVKLQCRGPNGTMIDVVGATLAGNGFVEVDLGVGSIVQAVISGSPTGLYLSVVPVPK